MKVQDTAPIADAVPRNYCFAVAPDLSRLCELKDADQEEALKFLAMRPVHTVIMTGFIKDNGIESALNRGSFYGYRNAAGELEGIALIGHSTLVEARTEEALKGLAFKARSSTLPIHLIMSAGDVATSFWNYLRAGATAPPLKCTELLFEIGFPFPVQPCPYEVRPARPTEVDSVAVAQAKMAEIESGVNPLDRDPRGFVQRVQRRIRQGRVLVAFDGDELVFKADIISETELVAYLEGVYVAPGYRGREIGSLCLSMVCLRLLQRVQTVCLLSNVNHKAAHRSFMKAGMRNTDACTTLFV